MVRVAVRADRLADAAKYADKIVDAKRAISSSLENGRKIHKTYMSLFEAEDVFVNRSLGKIYDEVSSRLRPDAVDTANRIMYELKPYNKESFVRALNQVESYLTTIGDNTSEWTIIIDMYS